MSRDIVREAWMDGWARRAEIEILSEYVFKHSQAKLDSERLQAVLDAVKEVVESDIEAWPSTASRLAQALEALKGGVER